MYAFLFSDSNMWFSVAIGIVLALFTIEILGMLFGLSLMGLLDDVSPIELDASADTSADIGGGFSSILSWLCLDRLPLMIWMILLLTAFGLVGYLINFSTAKLLGFQASIMISIPLASILALIITGRLGSGIAKLVPKNESSATHQFEFEGMVGHITLGSATSGSPAEAKCVDQFEQAHYLMVEPIEKNESFSQNDKIVLVQKGTQSWLATRY